MRILSIWLVLVFSILVISTSTASAIESYQVFLYYDHGKLYLDRNQDPKVIVEEGATRNKPGNFRAEIVDKEDQVLYFVNFEPRPEVCVDYPPPNRALGGCRLEDQGRTAVQLLYSPIGTKLSIYDSAGKLILEHDISYLARCRVDNVCDAFYGEDISICPQDCKEAVPIGIGGEVGNGGISWFLWIAAIAVTSILGFVLWKFWRRRASQQFPL